MFSISSQKKEIPTITINKNITKCIGYNAMGKTIFLKLILNIINKNINNYKKNKNYSTSQKKKKLFTNLNNKIWILDEPHTALDYYNFMYLKTIMIEHINKNGTIIYTQNKMKYKNKIFYFYISFYWI
jgi:ABC-type uncharacterized transport system ATPase subunit